MRVARTVKKYVIFTSHKRESSFQRLFDLCFGLRAPRPVRPREAALHWQGFFPQSLHGSFGELILLLAGTVSSRMVSMAAMLLVFSMTR